MVFEELYRNIISMPESVGKVDAFKEAIRLADQANETAYGFKFRMELIDDAAYDGRFSDVRDAFGAMGWIFKKADDGLITDINLTDLIDKEQWVCRWMAMYPDITLTQLGNLLEDLKHRLSDAGYSSRFYYEAVVISSLLTDQKEKAAEAYQQYRKGRKDAFLSCDDCIACRYIKYFRYAGAHKEAFKEGAALEWPGNCNMNPKTAYNELLASAVENNDYENIDIYQQRGYKMIAHDPYFLDFIGYHMQYYAHTDPAQGLELYKRHLGWLGGRNRFPLSVYDFHMGAAVLFRKFFLADNGSTFTATLDKTFLPYMPETAKINYPDNRYSVKELMLYHFNEAYTIAKKFDARNGTSYYTAKLERLYGGV